MMFLLRKTYTNPRILHTNMIRYMFSDKDEQTKVQAVGFKKNVINDFNKIAYEPQQKLNFVNGKCLIYQNKRSILTSIMQSSLYWIPITGISYLIYSNPFADFFPAAIPILAVLDLIIMKLWINKMKWNSNIVGEIYLLDHGDATEIFYHNKTKRKLFGEDIKKIYYNSLFVNPDYDKQQIVLLNKDQRVFPNSVQRAKETEIGYAWVKHFSNGQNFLVIPKKPQYMNLEVLIQIFKGKVIKNKVI